MHDGLPGAALVDHFWPPFDPFFGVCVSPHPRHPTPPTPPTHATHSPQSTGDCAQAPFMMAAAGTVDLDVLPRPGGHATGTHPAPSPQPSTSTVDLGFLETQLCQAEALLLQLTTRSPTRALAQAPPQEAARRRPPSPSKPKPPGQQRRVMKPQRPPPPAPHGRRKGPLPPVPHGNAAALARLAAPRRDVYVERERQRRAQEETKVAQEGCTFAPRLCHGTEKWAAAANEHGRADKPLPERLGDKQAAAEAARRRRHAHLEQKLLQECTFRPTLYTAVAVAAETGPSASGGADPAGSPSRRPPLHERLGDVQRSRRDHLDKLRARAEDERNQAWTFRPLLCGVSEDMARQRRLEEEEGGGEEEGDDDLHDLDHARRGEAQGHHDKVTTHMARETQRFLQRRMAKRWALEQAQLEDCRFTPRLCERTEALLTRAGLPQDFDGRQDVWEAECQKRRNKTKAAQQQEEEQWFKPVLTQQGRAAGSRTQPPKDTVVQRLAVAETARRDAARRQRTDAHYAQFQYQPTLNPLSRALGRPSSTTELAYNWRGEMARAKAAEDAQARFDADCTFSPSTFTSSNKGRLDFRDPASIRALWEEQRRTKDRQAAEAAKAREAEELQACTWQPQLVATTAVPARRRQEQHQSPVLVRGLGKFLMRSDAAARARATTASQAAGGRTPATTTTTTTTTTTPKPFRLSARPPPAQRGSRAAVRAEAERQAMETLTFRPETIERRKQEALRRLLLSVGLSS